MIFGSPVRGLIHVDARYYPKNPAAWKRPAGNHEPALTQDFGPSSVTAEPKVIWPGGEGIAAGTYAHFHKGIDISTAGCGADVLAAAAGTVRVSYRTSAGEHVIVLDHGDGWCTSYGHMASRTVTKGATVKAGQKIGTIGATGNAAGCHLHFGVKSDVPAGANYYSSTVGKMRDPWPRLAQNVTVHPVEKDGINIRETAGTGATLGAKYAVTLLPPGVIVRPDGTFVDGPITAPRKWGGTVTGASYPAGAGYPAGDKWEAIELDGAMRFVASPLAVLSAR